MLVRTEKLKSGRRYTEATRKQKTAFKTVAGNRKAINEKVSYEFCCDYVCDNATVH